MRAAWFTFRITSATANGDNIRSPRRATSTSPFRLSSQDYYFRYDLAIQLDLVGESLMGWLAKDLSRGVDVLLAQQGVDPARIAIVSEPAGGGDVAAVAAALDERIQVAMINNFGGPEPESPYPLPADVAESFSYTTSGSWESTRNLRGSVPGGFLPWAIVAGIAPRRVIYYHEFYWDRPHDPVWRRFQQVFRWHSAEIALAGLAGHGFVVVSAPENTHWTPESRALLNPLFQRWLGIKPGPEYSKLFPEEQLLCHDATRDGAFKSQPVYEICRQLGTPDRPSWAGSWQICPQKNAELNWHRLGGAYSVRIARLLLLRWFSSTNTATTRIS